MNTSLISTIYVFAGTDKPNIILLNKHVREDAAPQWRDLGGQLLMKAMTHKLDVIDENYQDDVKECCNQMFSHWLYNFEVTWNKILHTLEQTGHSEVATTVKNDDNVKG